MFSLVESVLFEITGRILKMHFLSVQAVGVGAVIHTNC